MLKVAALEPACLDLNPGSTSQLLSVIMAKILNFLHLSFLPCKVRIIDSTCLVIILLLIVLIVLYCIECVNTDIASNKY